MIIAGHLLTLREMLVPKPLEIAVGISSQINHVVFLLSIPFATHDTMFVPEQLFTNINRKTEKREALRTTSFGSKRRSAGTPRRKPALCRLSDYSFSTSSAGGSSVAFFTSSITRVKSTAFWEVITGTPVSASMACLVRPATAPLRQSDSVCHPWKFQFQLLTICQQLVSALRFQPLFQFCPVVAGSALRWLPGKHSYHIHNRKVPFLGVFIPSGTDFFIFKKLNIIVHASRPRRAAADAVLKYHWQVRRIPALGLVRQ